MDNELENLFSDRSSGKEQNISQHKIAKGVLRVIASEKKYTIDKEGKENIWEHIDNHTIQRNKAKQVQFYWKRRWAVVASILLLFSASIGIFVFQQHREPPIVLAARQNQDLFNQSDNIELKLYDQEAIAITNDDRIDLTKIVSGANILSNKAYSTLTIPYGRKTEVLLPDGSTVWLNAGSQLTFPASFLDVREVYLEGEGYFDVVHSSKSPFYVHTANMRIEVLGTTFNVSAYKDDSFSSAALLTGKIVLSSTGKESFETYTMEAGSTAVLNKEEDTLHIKTEDTQDQILWTQQQLLVKNISLKELLVKLERIYGIHVISDGNTYENDTFSGRLDLTQPLDQVLKIIFGGQYILEHQETERRIIIKKG